MNEEARPQLHRKVRRPLCAVMATDNNLLDDLKGIGLKYVAVSYRQLNTYDRVRKCVRGMNFRNRTGSRVALRDLRSGGLAEEASCPTRNGPSFASFSIDLLSLKNDLDGGPAAASHCFLLTELPFRFRLSRQRSTDRFGRRHAPKASTRKSFWLTWGSDCGSRSHVSVERNRVWQCAGRTAEGSKLKYSV
jgi:hypothetical protein